MLQINFNQAEVVNNPSVCPANSQMANLVGMSDTVIRPVIVEPEGTPRDYTVSDFVCMTNPNSGEFHLQRVKI